MIKLSTATPYIACFVLLRQDNNIAFLRRANTGWRDGYYGLISGKVEWGESFSAGAIREAKEEADVTIKLEHLHHAITMHRHHEDSDWVDVFFEADTWEGEVINAEPEVHSELAWLAADNLPDDVVPEIRYAIEQLQAGKTYAEYGWSTN